LKITIVIRVRPAACKSILTDHVILKGYTIEIMRSDFRGIYDTERGGAEVRFEHDLEPMEFGIYT
jgi:hypothetical protein